MDRPYSFPYYSYPYYVLNGSDYQYKLSFDQGHLKLEEVTSMEELDGDFEIVRIGLRDTYTYFANGYLCHQ